VASQSMNDIHITCEPFGDNGMTKGEFPVFGDQHDYDFDGTETIDVDSGYVSARRERTNLTGIAELAGVIWHEVMHVHGFQHGDNHDATAAAANCGYSLDPHWDWRWNSANYLSQQCIEYLGSHIVEQYFDKYNAGPPASALDATRTTMNRGM